jgi:hypothetical protein
VDRDLRTVNRERETPNLAIRHRSPSTENLSNAQARHRRFTLRRALAIEVSTGLGPRPHARHEPVDKQTHLASEDDLRDIDAG